LSDVQSVTAELRARRSIFADAQHAIRSADAAAQQIRALAASGQNLVDGDGRRITGRLVSAADEIEATAREVRGMVHDLNGPTSDFAATGLPQIQAAIVSLQTAADTLNRVASEVEQNPRGLISRPPAQEVEVPQ
jgi:phospholipid/cholesterol/gamma-HCH transport system substrate-binding protein